MSIGEILLCAIWHRLVVKVNIAMLLLIFYDILLSMAEIRRYFRADTE